MSSVKISELPLAATTRNDDELIINTGLRAGETPETKRATKAQLSMSEGGAQAYNMIMGFEPIHYWTMDGGNFPHDEVNNITAFNESSVALNVIGPISKGSPRNLINYQSNLIIDSNQAIDLIVDFSITSVIRPSSATQRIFGNNSSDYFQGFGLYKGSNNQLIAIFGTGSAFVEVTSANNALTNLVLNVASWTFDSVNGHKLFVNGTQVASSTNTTIIATAANNFKFCNLGIRVAQNLYSGQMQDVAIFDKVLTPTEIQDISDAILGV